MKMQDLCLKQINMSEVQKLWEKIYQPIQIKSKNKMFQQNKIRF